jgi:hypothetical protein
MNGGGHVKTIFLIIALIIPTFAAAGSFTGNGYVFTGANPRRFHQSHKYMSDYTHHVHLRRSRHFRSRASSGPAFDFSAYPSGGHNSPDPPNFHYQSITPGGGVEGVHTWTDASGTVHFTDDPGKEPGY